MPSFSIAIVVANTFSNVAAAKLHSECEEIWLAIPPQPVDEKKYRVPKCDDDDGIVVGGVVVASAVGFSMVSRIDEEIMGELEEEAIEESDAALGDRDGDSVNSVNVGIGVTLGDDASMDPGDGLSVCDCVVGVNEL